MANHSRVGSRKWNVRTSRRKRGGSGPADAKVRDKRRDTEKCSPEKVTNVHTYA